MKILSPSTVVCKCKEVSFRKWMKWNPIGNSLELENQDKFIWMKSLLYFYFMAICHTVLHRVANNIKFARSQSLVFCSFRLISLSCSKPIQAKFEWDTEVGYYLLCRRCILNVYWESYSFLQMLANLWICLLI